jgi:hypothetical protein
MEDDAQDRMEKLLDRVAVALELSAVSLARIATKEDGQWVDLEAFAGWTVACFPPGGAPADLVKKAHKLITVLEGQRVVCRLV